MGARAAEYKFGVRADKYKFGVSIGKYKLGARAGGRETQTPVIKSNVKTSVTIYIHSTTYIHVKLYLRHDLYSCKPIFTSALMIWLEGSWL